MKKTRILKTLPNFILPKADEIEYLYIYIPRKKPMPDIGETVWLEVKGKYYLGKVTRVDLDKHEYAALFDLRHYQTNNPQEGE